MSIVEVSSGRLEGVTRADHEAFFGIPYAAAPKGELRFRAPAALEPWTGIRSASSKGFAAPQTISPIPGVSASGTQDEDCLNLNVFTQATDGAKRPVLFWIHGGGYTHGAGYEPLYDGGRLAVRGDVVVVTINYRLGALGFLYLGDHMPDAELSANVGLLDQIAALRWTKQNIAAFGGDPNNVTIFGESAGGGSVHALTAMPAAKGLFKRAIIQSGVGHDQTLEDGARQADLVLKRLGLDIEGGFASDVDMMIGSNRDEWKFLVSLDRPTMSDDGLLAHFQQHLPRSSATDAQRLIDVYRASRGRKNLPAANLDISDALLTDLVFHKFAIDACAAQSRHRATYSYLFCHASPARRGALGSCHALEMPFVFGATDHETQRRFAGAGPEVTRLSEIMMDAWIAFAHTGRPHHSALPAWPSYEASRRATMIFDLTCELENDPFHEERAALQALA